MNKTSGGDGIPADLFQILKDDALKEVYSVCQQIWKVQQKSQDWKTQVFIQSQIFPVFIKINIIKFISIHTWIILRIN